MAKTRMIRLGAFREDPDNVSEATEAEIKRLAAKLRRVPLGLTEMRIAYVTDAASGNGVAHWRIHHNIQWNNVSPKIISSKWRK